MKEPAPDAPLEWEARAGRYAAGAAFLAAGLIAASAAIQTVAIGLRPSLVAFDTENLAEALVRLDEHWVELALARGMQSVSFLLLAAALYYLARVAIYRRPHLRGIAGMLLFVVTPVAALVLLAAAGMLMQLEVHRIAAEFVAAGDLGDARAKHLLGDPNFTYRLTFVLGSALLMFITPLSFGAMAAGLWGRFMVGLSVIVIPVTWYLGQAPAPLAIVLVVYLVALGALFLDRWPGGRGDAWKTGRAHSPWASRPDQAARRSPSPAPASIQRVPAAADDDTVVVPAARVRARAERLAAGAALLAAGLAAASVAIQTAAVGTRPAFISSDRNPAEALISLDEHRVEIALSRGLHVLSCVLLAAAVYYLVRGFNIPRRVIPRRAVWLLLAAPPLIAAGALGLQADLNQIAGEFLASGDPTNSRAKNLLEGAEGRSPVSWGGVMFFGSCCFLFAFFPIGGWMRRAGPSGELMGWGLVLVALAVMARDLLPAVVAVFEVVYLVALGALMLDRWPGGRGLGLKIGKAAPPACPRQADP